VRIAAVREVQARLAATGIGVSAPASDPRVAAMRPPHRPTRAPERFQEANRTPACPPKRQRVTGSLAPRIW